MGSFLDRIVTRDETWVHYHKLQSKQQQQSVESQHKDSPTKTKFKAQPSGGTIMCSAFWDMRGVIPVYFLEWVHTINFACYVEMLKKLKVNSSVRPENKGKILLQYNARPHTSILTRETNAEFRWTVLPHCR
jgi:hypothetical protein